MADLVRRDALLPPFATPAERAIGEANAAVVDVDHEAVRLAGSPNIAEVPAVYLPARAEARSVDVWGSQWPEAVQRAAIVAAPAVHRHKGTVYAVKTALSALGVTASITEWWQTSPEGAPYTFSVKAYASARLYDGPVLDGRLIRVIYASILRAKPHSRAFDLIVGASFPTPFDLAPVLVGKLTLGRGVVPRPNTKTAASLGLAPVLVGKVVVARAVIPALPA